jgi:hypothetical protein
MHVTVEGELCVANFLVNYFSGVHFQTPVAVHPCQVVPKGTAANCHHRVEPVLAHFTSHAQAYDYCTVQ